ncbi:MAG: UbiA family prenyltransferase, partial [Flavobacteriales bacterium]|nr:UbiA family prenyltransferase [Flavobacteriales bacterium]
MRATIDLIRLTRPLNLLIIVLTMYAMRFGIMRSILELSQTDFELQLSEGSFLLSVIVMVLLAAAGNIINDYFDVRVDRINKPERVLVGRTVKRRVAMVAHHSLNLLAVFISLYLAWKAGIWILFMVPVFMAGSLWSYSLSFKRQFWIGNFIVALMVAIVPLWAGIFEVIELITAYTSIWDNEIAMA